MKKLVTVVTLLLSTLIFALPTTAQISIQTNDLLSEIGSSFETMSANNIDASFFNSVTNGIGNQVFDFSLLSFQGVTTTYLIDPVDAPFTDSFPSANVVTVSIENNNVEDSIWNYLKSVPESFEFLGVVLDLSPAEKNISKFNSNGPDYTFPLNFNDQWTKTRHTSSSFFGVSVEVYDTSFNNIDAYGTAIYNGNSVPCLRVSYVERITTIITNPNTMPVVTTISLEGAIFITNGFDILTSVQKVITNTNVSYIATSSSSFVRIPTDITELDINALPDGYILSQNYPNPFNPSTEIQFSIPTSSDVQLEIYNIQGQIINVLVDKKMSAGSYIVDWNSTNTNGTAVASGVYFYRLIAGDVVTSKKMLLLK